MFLLQNISNSGRALSRESITICFPFMIQLFKNEKNPIVAKPLLEYDPWFTIKWLWSSFDHNIDGTRRKALPIFKIMEIYMSFIREYFMIWIVFQWHL